MMTPKTEKTSENPSTKNTEFRIMFVLLMEIIFVPEFWLRSLSVVPEMYARNAGIIGKIHGATNDPIPANVATNIDISAM